MARIVDEHGYPYDDFDDYREKQTYQDVSIKVKTYKDDGVTEKTISIFIDDEEVVYGAPTLKEAIQQFDYVFWED